MTHVEPLGGASRSRTSPPGSAQLWLLILQLFPGTQLEAGFTALLGNVERPGIHASELTHRDVSQEASWEVSGSQ